MSETKVPAHLGGWLIPGLSRSVWLRRYPLVLAAAGEARARAQGNASWCPPMPLQPIDGSSLTLGYPATRPLAHTCGALPHVSYPPRPVYTETYGHNGRAE